MVSKPDLDRILTLPKVLKAPAFRPGGDVHSKLVGNMKILGKAEEELANLNGYMTPKLGDIINVSRKNGGGIWPA